VANQSINQNAELSGWQTESRGELKPLKPPLSPLLAKVEIKQPKPPFWPLLAIHPPTPPWCLVCIKQ